jgi:predicted RNA-binding protein YlqC (UPF0109 family)
MTLYLETGFEGCGIKFPNTGYLLEKGDKSDVKIFSNDFYEDSDDIEQAQEKWSVEFGLLVLKGDANYYSDDMTYKGEKYKITTWVNKYDETCWEKNGFDSEDFELAEECGILTPRNAEELKDEVDFQTMIEKEEQFFEDGEQDIDEYEKCRSVCVRECEVIQKEKIVEQVEVRIIKISNKFGIGAIDGNACVYIPQSVIRGSLNTEQANEYAKKSQKSPLNFKTQIDYGKRTIGEICSMNLVYNPCGKNVWKAVYIHPKVEPFVKARLVQPNGKDVWQVEIPKQDLGKMIGKQGSCIQKIKKDILYNYPEMQTYWKELDKDHYVENGWKDDYVEKYIEDAFFPSFDINQGDDCTLVNIWNDNIQINVNDDNDKQDLRYSGFCPIQGVLKKMYC